VFASLEILPHQTYSTLSVKLDQNLYMEKLQFGGKSRGILIDTSTNYLLIKYKVFINSLNYSMYKVNRATAMSCWFYLQQDNY